MTLSFTLLQKSVSNSVFSTPVYGKCQCIQAIQDVFQNKNQTGTTIKKTNNDFLPLAQWVYINPTVLLPYQGTRQKLREKREYPCW